MAAIDHTPCIFLFIVTVTFFVLHVIKRRGTRGILETRVVDKSCAAFLASRISALLVTGAIRPLSPVEVKGFIPTTSKFWSALVATHFHQMHGCCTHPLVAERYLSVKTCCEGRFPILASGTYKLQSKDSGLGLATVCSSRGGPFYHRGQLFPQWALMHGPPGPQGTASFSFFNAPE